MSLVAPTPATSKVLRVQSNLTEALAQTCVAQIQLGGKGIFSPEIVVVQRPGMDRWLSQFVAGHAGLAWDFQSVPLRKLWVELAQLSPWSAASLRWVAPSRLRFAILEQLALLDDDPVWAPLVPHTQDRSRALAFAERQAALFESYLDDRPEVLLAWEQGEQSHDWQAQLWRALLAQREESFVSPAKLRAELLRWLDSSDPTLSSALLRVFGPRIHFFGFTEIPPWCLRLMQSLSAHLSVAQYRLVPSAAFLGDCQDSHPLLHSWSPGYVKLSLAMEHGQGGDAQVESIFMDRTANVDLEARSDLERLVESFRRADCDGLAFRGDTSIQIHSCWGAMREVEVLHDRIAAALLEYPSWSFEDVVVWVSDLATYAPLIDAVFAPVEPAPGPTIPYRIVDAHPSGHDAGFSVLFPLLESFAERSTRERLLDLMSLDPVRRAFEWSDEQLDELAQGIDAAQIRWGRDQGERTQAGQPEQAANSWEHGLWRWVLGRAYHQAPWADTQLAVLPGQVQPMPGPPRVEDASLGALSRFLERYFQAKALAQDPTDLVGWASRCEAWVTSFLPEEDQGAGLSTVSSCLSTLLEDHRQSGAPPQTFDLASWTKILQKVSESVQRGAPWGRGGVTFAQLLSARPVPAKLVALLGMGEGQFPRNPSPEPWSVHTREPSPHELSLRDEDRIAMVESLLCARERWICVYTGRDPQGESDCSPSPFVQELDLFLQAHGPGPDHRFVSKHALSAHEPKAWSDADPRLVGHRRLDWDIALLRQRLQSPSTPTPTPIIEQVLETPMGETIQLQELQRYLGSASAQMLQASLGVRVQEASEPWSGQEPGILSGLERYGVVQALLQVVLEGGSIDEAGPVLAAQGRLPWGEGGQAALRAQWEDLSPLRSVIAQECPAGLGAATFRRWTGQLVCGAHRLQGVVGGPVCDGTLYRVSAGRLSAKRKLSAWVDHLFVCATSDPNFQGTKIMGIERSKGVARVVRCQWPTFASDEAGRHLEQLLRIYAAGLSWPLPIFLQSGLAYAQAIASGKKDAEQAMRSAQGEFVFGAGDRPSESQKDWPTQRLFDGSQVLEDQGARAALGQAWPCTSGSELSDFAALSLAIWMPCLTAMEEC